MLQWREKAILLKSALISEKQVLPTLVSSFIIEMETIMHVREIIHCNIAKLFGGIFI